MIAPELAALAGPTEYPYPGCSYYMSERDRDQRDAHRIVHAWLDEIRDDGEAKVGKDSYSQRTVSELYEAHGLGILSEIERERARRRTVVGLLRLPTGRLAVRNLAGRSYSAETDALATRKIVKAAAAILTARASRVADRKVANAARVAQPGRYVRVLADLLAKRTEAKRQAISAALLPRANYRVAKQGHDDRVKITTGTPHAASDTSADRSVYKGSFKGWAATISEHTYHVRETWLQDVHARGLATVDGLLVLDAQPVESSDGHEVYTAIVVEQGRGTSLNTVHGYIVRHGGEVAFRATLRAALQATCRTYRRVLATA